MVKLVFRVLALFSGLWIALVVFVVVLPYDSTRAGEFMSLADNCGGICLLGIQPGITRVGEALVQLRGHSWVSDVQENAQGNGYAQISWGWSGEQPQEINTARRGRITFYWVNEDVVTLEDSVVETITIYTDIRIFSLQNWLGETDSGAATLRPDGKLGYSVLYDIQGGILNLYVELPCPAKLMTYWDAHSRITLSIGRSNQGFVQPIDLVGVCRTPQG